MIYSHEVEAMTCVARATNHGAAPIPQEGKWTKSKEIKDINGLTPVSYTHLLNEKINFKRISIIKF